MTFANTPANGLHRHGGVSAEHRTFTLHLSGGAVLKSPQGWHICRLAAKRQIKLCSGAAYLQQPGILLRFPLYNSP